jgi:hypothetical protein
MNKRPLSVSTYLSNRLERVLSFDSVRALKIVELFQYSVLCTSVALIVAVLLDKSLNRPFVFIYTDEIEDMATWQVFVEAICIAFLLVIIAFYVKKIMMVVPSIAHYVDPRFQPHTTNKYAIDIIFIVLITSVSDAFISRVKVVHRRLMQ